MCNNAVIVKARRAWFIGILRQYWWLSSLSVMMQTFSWIPMREENWKNQILILTLLKFLFFPSPREGGKKKSKSRNFGARHLHFLVDFDLILVYVPLMCMVANCTFSLMGRALLTMAYSAVFNHVSCLQLLLRIKFHPLHFQMGCTISCFSLQDCLWFENSV